MSVGTGQHKTIKNPHSISIDRLLESLSTDTKGLSNEEAKQRLNVYGTNTLPDGKKPSVFALIIKQFQSGLVIVLILAALISLLVGQIIDTWIIVGAVLVNTAIGFVQEYRAGKAVDSLQSNNVKIASVIRNNQLTRVPAADLVPGDIIVLQEGDSITADGRIFQSTNFRTSEASLTGESIPVSKREGICGEQKHQADQFNMVWRSTFVAGGYAQVLVTHTGSNTFIGSISETLHQIKNERTSFMKKTDVLAKQMSIVAVCSAVVFFLIGYYYRHFEINDILLTSVAALVAAVPEGLSAIISITLAIGAQRMAKKHAIVREFTATEVLGSVTTILTDKTGTLTQNSLTVRKVMIVGEKDFQINGDGWFPAGNFIQGDVIIKPGNQPVLKKLLEIGAVSNNSELNLNEETGLYELIGDPTEGALLTLARKGGVRSEILKKSRKDDLPFDSNLKLRASLYQAKEHQEIYSIGAPEKLLNISTSVLTSTGVIPLTPELKQQIQEKISDWSNQALRVIALAYKIHDHETIQPNAVCNLVFVGIAGMIDPPRPDSKAAVAQCKIAGIRTIMVTGDHINTAIAVAKSCGIIEETSDKVVALSQWQLEHLSDDELDEAIKTVSVFARLTPKMKLRIASRLQAMGELIAMTGDGVNDAPALKKADIGISMGIMGTDVARESSDIVLSNDNFATIVEAIKEGRIVFTNARKTSFFLITTNISETVTLLMSILLGLPIPLTAAQILWLNLVTDGVTDMALAVEPGHPDIMHTGPVKKNENILNKEVLPFLIINVTLMAGISLITFVYYLDEGLEKARTGVFIIMAFTQLFNVYNLRSIHLSVFKIGFFSNKYITLAVAVSILLLIIIVEIPAIAEIFHFQALGPIEFSFLFLISSSVLIIAEGYKIIVRSKKNQS